MLLRPVVYLGVILQCGGDVRFHGKQEPGGVSDDVATRGGFAFGVNGVTWWYG